MSAATLKAAVSWRYHVMFHHRKLPNLAQSWLDDWWDECEKTLRDQGEACGTTYVDFLLGRRARK